MKIFAKLVVCAFCATIPVAHAATPAAAPAAKAKPGVKAVKKSVKTRARGKTPKVGKAISKPLPAQAAMQPQPLPAAPVLALSAVTTPVAPARPVAPAAPQAAPTPRNPYLAEQYANAPANPYLRLPVATRPQGANPYMPKPAAAPTPWAASTDKPTQATWTPPQVLPAAPATPQPAPVMPQAAPAYVPASGPAPGANPYMAAGAPVNEAPAVSAPTPATTGGGGSKFLPSPLAQLDPMQDLNSLFNSVRNGIPALNGQDLLPTIKKVYPTGEKPLVILSFKCPTEMLGVTPPPMKALHEIVNYAFEGINKTNLLSFNMQQVCQ